VDAPLHPGCAPTWGWTPSGCTTCATFVATTLLASGTDLATVAVRLDHGSGGKTTLAIYGHFLRGAPPDRAATDLLAALLRPAEVSSSAT
jgi:hypothetical protein